MSTETPSGGSQDAPLPGGTDQGRCLCGAVTFTVTGDPIYNVICHCLNCKRQGGSTFHTASIFHKSQYNLLTGAENVTTYVDHATQTGIPLRRGFCRTCGSKISALTALNDDIVSVPAGILEHAGLDWTPQKEQFCLDKARWVPEFARDLVHQRFERGPTAKGVGEIK